MADQRRGGDPGRLGVPDPGYGRGYGRDFGGGYGQGFGGSWARGYGGSTDGPSAYREGLGEAPPNPPSGPHSGKGPGGWTRSDARLKEQVSEALLHDRLLDAREIEVGVEGGVVTLDGTVAAPSGVRLAEMIVQRVGGVSEVRNNLSVQAPATPDERAPLGVETGASSPLAEGEHDANGREEGPRHFPKLAM